MKATNEVDFERRVLILAPGEKDAALTASVLEQGGVQCNCFPTLEQICQELDRGAAAVLIAEEAILQDRGGCLAQWLTRQPSWSDLPVLVIARPGADSAVVAQAMDLLGNVTVLERPTRVAALVSAVRSALRARTRQYEIRAQFRQRERQLHTQAILGAIVSSSDDAIISKSLDGIIQTWNKAAERLFGYSAAEAIGQSIMMLIPPERQEEEPKILERLRRGEHIDHFETIRVAKNGRRIDISLTISPLRNSEGKIFGASKIARDITDRKQAEAALREADRRKDEFLAVLAHELRNPLAPIRNSLHLLRLSGDLGQSLNPVREIMERQVDQMVRLIDDLLDVSRIARGKIELQKKTVELATVVSTAVETAQPLIDAAGHQLAISLPAEPIILEADPVRLAQIMGNLLNNAAKYTPPGGQIWLSAHVSGDEVVISVRDSGVGIPANMLPCVFDMFAQVDSTLSRSQGGLGIGLTLAKTFVEMHGGRIEVHSDGANQGSEFLVYLPVLSDPRRKYVPTSRTSPQRAISRRRILVVDDTPAAGFVLSKLLEKMGQEVRVANDAATALAMARREHPDLVISDIGMPNIDGYELARQLRREAALKSIPLVALTGYGQDRDRQQTKEAGFDYHLVKPIGLEALEGLLARLPEAHRPPTSLHKD